MKPLNSIKCFKVLELISDLKARGIPVLNKNAKKNVTGVTGVTGVTEKAGSERLLVLVTHTSCLLCTICNSVSL